MFEKGTPVVLKEEYLPKKKHIKDTLAIVREYSENKDILILEAPSPETGVATSRGLGVFFAKREPGRKYRATTKKELFDWGINKPIDVKRIDEIFIGLKGELKDPKQDHLEYMFTNIPQEEMFEILYALAQISTNLANVNNFEVKQEQRDTFFCLKFAITPFEKDSVAYDEKFGAIDNLFNAVFGAFSFKYYTYETCKDMRLYEYNTKNNKLNVFAFKPLLPEGLNQKVKNLSEFCIKKGELKDEKVVSLDDLDLALLKKKPLDKDKPFITEILNDNSYIIDGKNYNSLKISITDETSKETLIIDKDKLTDAERDDLLTQTWVTDHQKETKDEYDEL